MCTKSSRGDGGWLGHVPRAGDARLDLGHLSLSPCGWGPLSQASVQRGVRLLPAPLCLWGCTYRSALQSWDFQQTPLLVGSSPLPGRCAGTGQPPSTTAGVKSEWSLPGRRWRRGGSCFLCRRRMCVVGAWVDVRAEARGEDGGLGGALAPRHGACLHIQRCVTARGGDGGPSPPQPWLRGL